MSRLKLLLNKLLANFDYQLQRKDGGWNLNHMRSLGFNPNSIIDVGVGEGTLNLYQAFPNAHYLLVEPLKEYENCLRDIQQKYRADYVLTAAGAEEGEVTINIEPRKGQWSSIQKRVYRATGDIPEKRVIPVQTLDTLVDKNKLKAPLGLKIDTEGYELNVLRGASSILPDVEFVIAETSVAKRFDEGYSFAEMIAFMDEKGFDLYDILEAPSWNSPSPLGYIDAMFVPRV
jgi:FkbM family methyltransferase